MKTLLAAAGSLALVVLAGSTPATAAARPPAGFTLRGATGSVQALAQDGGSVAWLASGGMKCNAVQVLTRSGQQLSLPQPSSGSMTCHWDLTGGPTQLAYAARTSTALWTLHEGGPSPFDLVLTAPVGGPEQRLERLAHASDGTGDWLGSVAGSGRTLAYSWNDVEYVDKLGCLSGGSCKRKIANGGINIVPRTGNQPQPLPGTGPALQLAASSGRIAYVPATTVKANHPGASANNFVYVVDGTTGDPVSSAYVRGVPLAIALSPHVLAVLTQTGGPRDRITWFSATGGTKLGSVLVSHLAAPQLAASDRLIVYRVGRVLRGISTGSGRNRILARTGANWVGLALQNGRLVWAENTGGTGRIRTLAVG